MSAEVNIIAAERDGALLAPTEALVEGALWVVRDGKARRTVIKVGLRDLLRAEILEGVAEERPRFGERTGQNHRGSAGLHNDPRSQQARAHARPTQPGQASIR